MNDLIPIQTRPDGSRAVSMRALHVGLEVATGFTDWAKRMFAYGFQEGIDYVEISLPKSGERVHGGQNRRDWALTMDTAKEIAMVQRTVIGQRVRRYFIEIEKQPARELSRADLAHMVIEQEEEKAALAATIEQQKPMADYHERFIAEQDDIVTVDNFAGQYGSTGPTVRDLLTDSGLAARKLIGKRWSRSKRELEKVYEWRARQGLPTSEWFDLRPQHDAPRLHNGQVRQTLYIRQYYAEQLAVKLGLAQPAFQIPA